MITWIATDWHWAIILGVIALITIAVFIGDIGDLIEGLIEAFFP